MQTRTGKSTPGRAPRGFTIVELIVALVLVAIFAALTVPALTQTMARNDARRAARAVANVFRTARNQATSRGEVVFVRIQPDTDEGTVSLRRTDGNETSCGLASATTGSTTEVGDPVVISEMSSRMTIDSVNTEGASDPPSEPNWLCFAPGGQVVDSDGEIFYDDQCNGTNFRIFLADKEATVNEALTACPTNQSDRHDLDDDRAVAYYWEVRVPYNGAIEAMQ